MTVFVMLTESSHPFKNVETARRTQVWVFFEGSMVDTAGVELAVTSFQVETSPYMLI